MKILSKIYSRFTGAIQKNKSLGRAFIAGIFILAVTVILPRSYLIEYYYEVGYPWQSQNLYSPFDFSIVKSDKLLEEQRDTALRSIQDIFLEKSSMVVENRLRLIRDYQEIKKILDEWRLMPTKPNFENLLEEHKLSKEWLLIYKVIEEKQIFPFLNSEYFLQAILNIYDDIYSIPYIDKQASEIQSDLISIRKNASHEALAKVSDVNDKNKVLHIIENKINRLGSIEKNIAKILLTQYCVPNYYLDMTLMEKEKQLILSSISKYYSQIHKGQLIVQRGQQVTPEIKEILDSLTIEKNEKNSFTNKANMFMGQMVVVALLTIILLYYLRANQKPVFYRNQNLIFLLMVYFIMMSLLVLILNLGQNLLANYPVNYYHLAPMCMASIIVTVFFDDKIGFVTNTTLSIIGSIIVPNSFEFFFIHFTAGSIAIYSLSFMRSRSQFFLTNVILFIAYCVSYLGYNLYLTGSFEMINFNNLILFAINISFSLATYPLIYLFEKIFGLSSDLTYIELLDMKHPLLVEMSVQAPGTYQHSLQVATLAESAANKIGANGLQCRVGALFHDIGKIENPEFFIENQKSRDAHSNLSFQESAKVIINHVIKGIELAQQHNLPLEIVEFIRTHHGNSRVEYFYRKHIAIDGNGKDDNQFRYPGPLPHSKEQAIVMIADSCEAACRSLDGINPEQINLLVEKIVELKVSDNQLIHSQITFRDLNKIKSDIQKNLNNMYHKRIKYPNQTV